MAKKSSMGRGLSALMAEMGALVPEPVVADAAPQDRPAASADGGAMLAGAGMVPVAMIAPAPDQPRRQFDEAALTELANSILERGVLQPILVRPLAAGPDGVRYEIVAGERRWRASQLAGKHEIPVVVRAMDDAQGFEAALIENVQRADLNPIEEAQGYDRLIRVFGHTQFSVSDLTGKSRSHIANLLRLLDLPEEARALVQMGLLSLGHAKAVLASAEPAHLAREITMRGLSVRQAEEEARRSLEGPRAARAGRDRATPRDADSAAVETMLADALGMRVELRMKGKGGVLQVKFSDLDQLDEVIGRLQAGGGAK